MPNSFGDRTSQDTVERGIGCLQLRSQSSGRQRWRTDTHQSHSVRNTIVEWYSLITPLCKSLPVAPKPMDLSMRNCNHCESGESRPPAGGRDRPCAQAHCWWRLRSNKLRIGQERQNMCTPVCTLFHPLCYTVRSLNDCAPSKRGIGETGRQEHNSNKYRLLFRLKPSDVCLDRSPLVRKRYGNELEES